MLTGSAVHVKTSFRIAKLVIKILTHARLVNRFMRRMRPGSAFIALMDIMASISMDNISAFHAIGRVHIAKNVHQARA